MYSIDNQLKIEDFIFPYGELAKNNRLGKLASIIPWHEFEEIYVIHFNTISLKFQSLRRKRKNNVV